MGIWRCREWDYENFILKSGDIMLDNNYIWAWELVHDGHIGRFMLTANDGLTHLSMTTSTTPMRPMAFNTPVDAGLYLHMMHENRKDLCIDFTEYNIIPGTVDTQIGDDDRIYVMTHALIQCPKCNNPVFDMNGETEFKCRSCGHVFPVSPVPAFANNHTKGE